MHPDPEYIDGVIERRIHDMKILITGASRGLGAQLTRLLPRLGDELFLVSRTEPVFYDDKGVVSHWIPADLSKQDAPETIASMIPDSLDVLIHNAGIWEKTAFTSDYDFTTITPEETQRIVDVNLVAPMLITRSLLPRLRLSENPKIIFIGSANGIENSGFPETAYGASKWGLRGVAYSLREFLRSERIGVTVINLGTIGDQIHNREGEVAAEGMPYSDVANILRCVIETSRKTNIKEISVPAMMDESV